MSFEMGRNLNLDFLSATECEHILAVLRQDVRLRDAESRRLSHMQTDLVEESVKRSLLSKYCNFKEKSCIRCLSRFFLLFNSPRLCTGCNYSVCKKCIVFYKDEAKYLCKTCIKHKEFKQQSNEWFYFLFSKKYKRCAGDKVMDSLLCRPGTLCSYEVSPGSSNGTQTAQEFVRQVDTGSDLLQLVEHVSKTQGQMSTTANRMLHSANDINAIYEELDKMDATLNDLELDIADVAIDTLSTEDYHQQTSAEAVGDVTSAALELLGSFSHAIYGNDNQCGGFEQDYVDFSVMPAGQSHSDTKETQKPPKYTAESFKHLEEQIYLKSSDVFSLEEHIQQLTERLLATDENTDDHVMSMLESHVALAVAKVAHSDMEVSEIEQSLYHLSA